MDAEFHEGWREWLALNLIRQVPERTLTEVLIQHGFEETFVANKIKLIRNDPIFFAAMAVYREKQKLGNLIDVFDQLSKQSGTLRFVESKQHLTTQEFYSQFFYSNRPVVIKGLARDWAALNKWTPQYFAEKFGDQMVEITTDRNVDSRFEDNFENHRQTVTMREFVKMVMTGGETNDFYLVAKNNLLSNEAFVSLRNDFQIPDTILNPKFEDWNNVKLWFGPKGTVTPLHHDAGSILFGQIFGRKQIKLISPFSIGKLYNDRTCFSDVDLEHIDYSKFPLMRNVQVLDVVIEPGDFILLPVGWWHWVKSLEISISLSFQNFYYNGEYIIWRS